MGSGEQIQLFLRRKHEVAENRRMEAVESSSNSKSSDGDEPEVESAPLIPARPVKPTLARPIQRPAGSTRTKCIDVISNGTSVEVSWQGDPGADELENKIRNLAGLTPEQV